MSKSKEAGRDDAPDVEDPSVQSVSQNSVSVSIAHALPGAMECAFFKRLAFSEPVAMANADAQPPTAFNADIGLTDESVGKPCTLRFDGGGDPVYVVATIVSVEADRVTVSHTSTHKICQDCDKKK